MLDGPKADAYRVGLDAAPRLGEVYVRCEQPDAVSGKICRHGPQRINAAIAVQHGAGERYREMGLEKGRLPGELGVARGMRLVEGISHEAGENFPDTGCFLLAHAGLRRRGQEVALEPGQRGGIVCGRQERRPHLIRSLEGPARQRRDGRHEVFLVEHHAIRLSQPFRQPEMRRSRQLVSICTADVGCFSFA